MAFEKIRDLGGDPCGHPEHGVPATAKLAPGVYRHICPGCGWAYTIIKPETRDA